jgi:carbamoyltransferase
MTFTIDVPQKLAKQIPEAVHSDGTSRFQSVTPANNSLFPDLLSQVKNEIGIGAVINTSFNLAGEPIVDSPFDAIRTFYSSGIDTLYIGNFKLNKIV